MTGGLVLAALAGLLIPAARGLRRGADAPRPNEMALAADGAAPGGDGE